MSSYPERAKESARNASTPASSATPAPVRKIAFHRPSLGAAERDAVIEVLDSR